MNAPNGNGEPSFNFLVKLYHRIPHILSNNKTPDGVAKMHVKFDSHTIETNVYHTINFLMQIISSMLDVTASTILEFY